MNEFIELLITLTIGFIGGTAGGLLGIGGGTLYVPALTLILSIEQSTAQGISLAAVIVTAISATSRNLSKELIDKSVILTVIPIVIICAIIGAQIAGELDQDKLRRIFGTILICVAIKNMLSFIPKKS
ncbi:MAG: sulfite exporter TauE/SafE family protein [Dehalococcoidia bacterium]|nr:sulfite exporter TauE/SafE family protein [Dehalococcoidia bacterium]